MVSTLSFSSRVPLRRGRIEGEPFDRKRYFLYLNQTQVGPENVLGSIRMCLLSDSRMRWSRENLTRTRTRTLSPSDS